MEYRHELKYIVDEGDLMIIENRLKNLLKYDENAGDIHSYNIRSVYFDDYDDSYLNENESGVNNRLKIRIRIYNHTSDVIKLEIKYKLNGMTKKESCNISKELCDKLINGDYIDYSECMHHKVLRKVYLETRMMYLKPKIVVEYDRTAFIYRAGNVRITFDRNIRSSKRFDLFFDDNTYPMPILEKGKHVLEVKYDEILPDHISQALEINSLNQTAFSKYYLSRTIQE